MTTSTIIYALLGGILPAFIWLTFWLYEDHKRPEPKGVIVGIFILGMLAVPLVLPYQQVVENVAGSRWIIAFALWALLEEVFKFLAAFFGGLLWKANDEPLDPMIYLITAALGFVALENTLYIVGALGTQGIAGGVITGNFRFIGSGLLHVLASSAVGLALALTYYKPLKIRLLWGTVGMMVAVLIHTVFNLFIWNQSGSSSLVAFAGVWVGIALLLLLFEKVKAIKLNPIEIPRRD